MNEIKPTVEKEGIIDISSDFLNISPRDFKMKLQRELQGKKLHIEIDWVDVPTARRLKAFVQEDGLNRTAKIRATKEQHAKEINVFTSGVEWEEVPG